MKESEEKKSSDNRAHICGHGELLRDILEGVMVKKKEKVKLEYFLLIIKVIYGICNLPKDMTWESNGGWWMPQTSLRSV